MPPREGGPVSPSPVLALWPPVAPSKRPKKSAVLFFEVEILDARTRDKLCFLDKVRGQRWEGTRDGLGVSPRPLTAPRCPQVEPQATVADIKNLFSKAREWGQGPGGMGLGTLYGAMGTLRVAGDLSQGGGDLSQGHGDLQHSQGLVTGPSRSPS